MQKISNFVRTSFKQRPIITNSIIYGSLYVGAETTQQIFLRKIVAKEKKPLDTGTIGRYAVVSTFAIGPGLTVWYRWLDKTFAGTALQTIAKKLLLDQFGFTPLLLIFFYTSMSTLERRSDLFEECREKFVPTFKASCMFWLPVQGLNFFLMPPQFRVVYISCASFAWLNILCWFKRNEVQQNTD